MIKKHDRQMEEWWRIKVTKRGWGRGSEGKERSLTGGQLLDGGGRALSIKKHDKKVDE